MGAISIGLRPSLILRALEDGFGRGADACIYPPCACCVCMAGVEVLFSLTVNSRSGMNHQNTCSSIFLPLVISAQNSTWLNESFSDWVGNMMPFVL
jgi:hypothetical protein